MNKRTIWPIIAVIFMIMGATGGVLLALSYIDGLNSGHIGPLPVSGNALTGAQRLLAIIAFALGGILLGFLSSTLVYAEMQRLKNGIERMSVQDKVAVIAGLLIGLLITVLITVSLRGIPTWGTIAIGIVLCYLGVTATLSMKEQLRLYFPDSTGSGKLSAMNALRPKILDTNVIIDGRIADVSKAGFLEGPIYIPRFVLEELQQIADSSDSLKRARGRRGLDILNQMRMEMNLQVETYESAGTHMPDEVDAKLVVLAKELNGSIVTNDYNLNKVAAIQGIKVLNVNELANALKPVVLPGEEMTVLVVKEGKEQNQGVGYLDDGTMIVVERGRRLIGDTVTVIVTSILQTAAGKMIFANLRQDMQQEEDQDSDQGIRGYTGGRTRRKIR
jgi:uncharacterized protein YacL